MEENLNYIIVNKYNEDTELEAYKIINKKKLVLDRLILIGGPLFGIIKGITSNNPSLLAAGIFMGVIFSYLLFNLERLQIKVLNKKFEFSENTPDKFTFFDSYYLFEKNNINLSKVGRVNYTQIDKIYISDNAYILQATNIKIISVIYKNGFELGINDEFTEFLKEKFSDKVVEV